jgi:diguanylate cyclase (GGDEF)-like protein
MTAGCGRATQVRSTDLLARYGGEELVLLLLLLPACAIEDAVRIIERLRAVTPQVTCSIGVTSWTSTRAAVRWSSGPTRALYAAKAEGRNRYVTA